MLKTLEFSAQKSCIYDLQWLNSFEIACGGGDQFTTLYDMNTCTRLAVLKGHTESVKSIAVIPQNQFVIATGSRDGSILIFDTRFNRTINQTDTNNEQQQQQVSNIRSVNSIQPAHFIDNNNNNNNNNNNSILAHKSNRSTNNATSTTHTNLINSNILKSKSSNQTSSNTTIMKRPSPVASVLFQNDNYLVSAGATDGLIKVWDIRKIHSSKKQTVETLPVYIFDNQPLPTSSCLTTNNNNNNNLKSTNKGYSNLIFNSSRTRLYANCMNGQLYEYNFSTYNNHMHTRSLSACSPNHSLMDEHNKPKLSYHTNQSNFIKSSLSQCENFILTGSSDFNAYLYSTNVNCMVNEFREKMPVIMLKGHTNEVTCVDWNPFDSNQLVTCSDDNTMRVWNVRRDMCEEKSNECNFSIAETCKHDNNNNNNTDMVSMNQFKYNSSIRYSKRLYNRYMPNVTVSLF